MNIELFAAVRKSTTHFIPAQTVVISGYGIDQHDDIPIKIKTIIDDIAQDSHISSHPEIHYIASGVKDTCIGFGVQSVNNLIRCTIEKCTLGGYYVYRTIKRDALGWGSAESTSFFKVYSLDKALKEVLDICDTIEQTENMKG